MKKSLVKFLAFGSIVLVSLASCKKSDTLVVTNGGTAGTLSTSVTTMVLDKAKLNDTTKVISFNFTNANYGYTSATTNTLQIDLASDNWAKPQSVTISNKLLSQGFSTMDFNSLLLKLGLTAGASSQVSARIAYSVGTSVKPVYSNVVTLTLTPFNLTSFLYVPGAYQGWNPATADSILSATSNGIYTGIINFTAGNLGFKITPAKTWTNSYGANGATVVYNGGSDITAPAAGLTWVTLNLNTNTITFAPVAYYYSIIGDATPGGWGSDTDMKYDNGNQFWTITSPFTAAAGQAFKVRRNHDWGTSYGTIATPNGVDLTSSNGGNISVTVAGTYKFNFSVNATDGTKATYTMIKQ
ncbi:SusE domain-containing protein [Mucilaginibacter sp.]|uniref:SusE domain-containing protein n=1 Tax=Mucilaginibacter sp. TaxID=1882438 RepID=UPI00261B0250|nr:SusE domain-containing protein [Mucilaginibacter sp.]MDB4924147.1 hypothetical protein [Mucilaginibacter sp.]